MEFPVDLITAGVFLNFAGRSKIAAFSLYKHLTHTKIKYRAKVDSEWAAVTQGTSTLEHGRERW